jgi:hypothetical protein
MSRNVINKVYVDEILLISNLREIIKELRRHDRLVVSDDSLSEIVDLCSQLRHEYVRIFYDH